MANQVVLAADRVPRWPDRCVVCGTIGPGETFELKEKKLELRVVGCEPCGRSLRTRRWIRRTIVTCASATGAIGAFVVARENGIRGGKLIALVGALVVAGPILLLQKLSPLPLEVSDGPSGIAYDFRDRAYADEFAALNEAKVS
jgi:hypothetical protein